MLYLININIIISHIFHFPSLYLISLLCYILILFTYLSSEQYGSNFLFFPNNNNNNRYALHSAAVTVLVLTGPGIRAPRACPPARDSGPAVCELAGEPILARMGCVQSIWYTFTITCQDYTVGKTKRNETKDRSHHFIACDCCITPIGGHLLSILEILKPRATLLFQVKARHSYTVDDDIATRDHDACIGQWYLFSQSQARIRCFFKLKLLFILFSLLLCCFKKKFETRKSMVVF